MTTASTTPLGPLPVAAVPLRDDRAFFGHPRGLSTLFFTEMWERFSYYGMRALLILFMTAAPAAGGLGFDTAVAGPVLIVIGTGLLKGNISVLVGQLYAPGDNRRDAGFSIYYMGINTGAFLAPLICGYLVQRVNWHLGFAPARI